MIIDSQPLTVAALAALLLGERLSALGVAGLGVGVAGLCLLEVPPQLLASLPSAAAGAPSAAAVCLLDVALFLFGHGAAAAVLQPYSCATCACKASDSSCILFKSAAAILSCVSVTAARADCRVGAGGGACGRASAGDRGSGRGCGSRSGRTPLVAVGQRGVVDAAGGAEHGGRHGAPPALNSLS